MRQFKLATQMRYPSDQRFAAVTGVAYARGADGLLHRVIRETGELAPEAGVSDADAEQFASLPAVWQEVTSSSQTQVVPPPPPAPEPGPPAVAVLEPVAAPVASALPPLPEVLDLMTGPQWATLKRELTIPQWVKAAADDGLGLTPEQQATRPKLDLVKLIYAHAAGANAQPA